MYSHKRSNDVTSRVNKPNPMYSYCRVIRCGKAATAGTSKGLNQRFCRRHEDHYERHGSPYKRSYAAGELAPHRKAAREWVSAYEEHHAVRLAINAVAELYYRSGRRIEAFRLSGESPEVRAGAVWAALRDRDVVARDVVALWLAVEAITASDPQPERSQEFKAVQAAKVLHRMAGGSHKRWEYCDTRGVATVKEFHKYSHSRGVVLRRLGQQLERAAAVAVPVYLAALSSSPQ